VTPYVVVRWSSPVTQARSVSAFGADVIGAHGYLVGDRDRQAVADELPSWLVWTSGMVFTVAPEIR